MRALTSLQKDIFIYSLPENVESEDASSQILLYMKHEPNHRGSRPGICNEKRSLKNDLQTAQNVEHLQLLNTLQNKGPGFIEEAELKRLPALHNEDV